jgi:hypothetical protein
VDAQKDSKDKPFINGSYNDKTDEGGTFTKFVPDIDKKKSGSEDFSDEEILGHELKHGWNKKNNLNQSNQKQMSADNKTNCEEVDAVNFQNIIREKEGKTARTKYGKNEIPKVDLVLPKNYKLQKR